MLNQLKSFGQTQGYFEIKRIGDFNHAQREGFSHINSVAIDFDKTKIKICNALDLNCCMSCDALDIIDSKNKINFIEFKELEDRANIMRWIKKLDLPQKIKDSRDILLNIIRNKNFVHKNKKIKFLSCEKNVIISFNLSSTASNRLVTLMRWTTVKEIIIKQFCGNYIQGEKFNEPICIRMDDFDSKYPRYA
jgi:hypothetical protein